MDDWPEALEPFRQAPDRSVLIFDYDGTLSPIVTDPSAARPADGAAELLGALAERYRTVAVVSGRSVDFLAEQLPGGLVLSGIYGLERIERGRRADHPSAGAWREVVNDVAALSEARGPVGMQVESKGLSITFHYRTTPELAADVEAWAQAQAARSGLERRAAKMSVELHPPVDIDKGTVVTKLALDASAVLYAADDLGDLPAFDALDDLASAGVHVLRVAVVGPESPAEIVDRADLTVASNAELVERLTALV